jgi:hypothetical protein
MRAFGLPLVLTAALAASGCFQMTTVVSVKGDGSGTIDHTMLVTKAALAQLRQFGALGGRGQTLDLVSEEQARAMAGSLGPGVTFVSSAPIDSPLAEGRRAQYAFTDITQLHISQQPETPKGLGGKVAPKESESITCTFTHEANGNSALHIQLPVPNIPSNIGSGADNPAVAQQLAVIRTLLAGARILIAVEPVGQLVRTNSPFVDGQRVTLLDVNLDQVLANEALLGKLQAAKTPEELKTALTNVPGLKVAFEREITIEFTAAK